MAKVIEPSATIDEKAGTLTLVLPLEPKGTKSASGKTEVVASTRGNKQFADATFGGQAVTVGCTAYVKPSA